MTKGEIWVSDIALRKLEQHLKSPNPKERSKTAEDLGKLKVGADFLVQALYDTNSYVRAAAIQALGNFTIDDLGQENLQVLASGLDDPNDYICQDTIRSLVSLNAKEYGSEIALLLEDKNPHIVAEAIRAVGYLEIEANYDQLPEFLTSRNMYVVSAAINAAARVGLQSVAPVILEQLTADYDQPDFFENLKNKRVIASLIEACGKLEIRESVPILVKIAHNRVGYRTMSINALLDLQAAEAMPLLMTLLNDPSKEFIKHLFYLIRRTNYREALPLLRPKLRHPSPYIRQAALLVIRDFDDRVSAPTVKEMIYQDGNPFNRELALQIYAGMMGVEILPIVLNLTQDPNPIMRRSAVKIIGELGIKNDEIIGAVSRVVQEDQDPSVVIAANEILAQLDVEKDAVIVEEKSPQNSWIPQTLRGNLPELLRSLETWQNALAGMIDQDNLSEASQIDAALSCLICQIRAEGEHG